MKAGHGVPAAGRHIFRLSRSSRCHLSTNGFPDTYQAASRTVHTLCGIGACLRRSRACLASVPAVHPRAAPCAACALHDAASHGCFRPCE